LLVIIGAAHHVGVHHGVGQHVIVHHVPAVVGHHVAVHQVDVHHVAGHHVSLLAGHVCIPVGWRPGCLHRHKISIFSRKIIK
jgi:hypothetical protein